VKRILIAEDNDVNRELLRELLQHFGYEVFEAANGVEALKEAARVQPDLFLLDIQMPHMDGITLLKNLRAEPKLASIPAIALTAYAMIDEAEKIKQAGFNGYVTKPFDFPQLKEAIERQLTAK
jgi:CheY-like chemotaxis protein